MNTKTQSTGAGKGSKPRPTDLKKFGENYDYIFKRIKKRIKKLDDSQLL